TAASAFPTARPATAGASAGARSSPAGASRAATPRHRCRRSSRGCRASSATPPAASRPLAVASLAGVAPERAALGATEALAERQPVPVARAGGLRVHLVVPPQLVGLLPAVEVEAVLTRLRHQFGELARRQRADPALGVDADPVQHFVLDDVAHAREQRLVQ